MDTSGHEMHLNINITVDTTTAPCQQHPTMCCIDEQALHGKVYFVVVGVPLFLCLCRCWE